VDPYGNVHLIWADKRDGNWETYYTKHDGDSWGEQVRLTKAAAQSRYPSLAAAPDGALHVIWSDVRDGSFEVYYKRRGPEDMSGLEDSRPESISLGQIKVVPNPILTSADLEFYLVKESDVTLSIHDVTGRMVRQLRPGPLGPGYQRILWNGNSVSGRRVAPGIYFLKITGAGQTASTKVLVLR
jgi:hypothetical protein